MSRGTRIDGPTRLLRACALWVSTLLASACHTEVRQEPSPYPCRMLPTQLVEVEPAAWPAEALSLGQAVDRFAEALAARGCALEPTIIVRQGSGRWRALVCPTSGSATDVWTLDASSGELTAAPCRPGRRSRKTDTFVSGMTKAFETAHADALRHGFGADRSGPPSGAAIMLREAGWTVSLYPAGRLTVGGVMRYVLAHDTLAVLERMRTQ